MVSDAGQLRFNPTLVSVPLFFNRFSIIRQSRDVAPRVLNDFSLAFCTIFAVAKSRASRCGPTMREICILLDWNIKKRGIFSVRSFQQGKHGKNRVFLRHWQIIPKVEMPRHAVGSIAFPAGNHFPPIIVCIGADFVPGVSVNGI